MLNTVVVLLHKFFVTTNALVCYFCCYTESKSKNHIDPMLFQMEPSIWMSNRQICQSEVVYTGQEQMRGKVPGIQKKQV